MHQLLSAVGTGPSRRVHNAMEAAYLLNKAGTSENAKAVRRLTLLLLFEMAMIER